MVHVSRDLGYGSLFCPYLLFLLAVRSEVWAPGVGLNQLGGSVTWALIQFAIYQYQWAFGSLRGHVVPLEEYLS